MTFADLPAGASIFLDANPLVYHFAPDPKFAAACSQLLARIVNQEIQAYTSTHVLSELPIYLGVGTGDVLRLPASLRLPVFLLQALEDRS